MIRDFFFCFFPLPPPSTPPKSPGTHARTHAFEVTNWGRRGGEEGTCLYIQYISSINNNGFSLVLGVWFSSWLAYYMVLIGGGCVISCVSRRGREGLFLGEGLFRSILKKFGLRAFSLLVNVTRGLRARLRKAMCRCKKNRLEKGITVHRNLMEHLRKICLASGTCFFYPCIIADDALISHVQFCSRLSALSQSSQEQEVVK